jgi:gluconolactonase
MKKTFVAEGLRFPEGPVLWRDGSVLLVEIERGVVTRVASDGTVSVLADLGGGPNGMALGPDGALYVCNNGGFLFEEVDGINRTRAGVPEGYAGGWIERLHPDTLEHRVLYTHCGGHRLVGPNDIAFDTQGGFYFTDYGKTYPRHRPHGGLYYALADGARIVEVAYPLVTPNGVGVSPDGATVYVAETETARLWAFDVESPGVVSRRRSTPFAPHAGRIIVGLPGYQRFDSLAVDADGNIHVATLVSGCITVISPSGEIIDVVATGDPMTTNICLDALNRSAWVTLSGTGRLLHIQR